MFASIAILFLASLYLLCHYKSGRQQPHVPACKSSGHDCVQWNLLNMTVQVLSDRRTCRDPNILLLILVTSHANNVKLRQKLRRVIPLEDLEKLKMRRLFLVGNPINPNSAGDHKNFDDLRKEQDRFNDLVMGDFNESYRNLTYKHMMGLSWAITYCPQAKLVLKQDDDILVDYYQISQLAHMKPIRAEEPSWNIQRMLFSSSNHFGKDKFILGKSLNSMKVIRDRNSKWFVQKSEYPADVYPSFVSGWGYLTTVEAIRSMLERSSPKEYFWIDDVFVTGTLRNRADVTILDMSSIFTHYKGHILCCLFPKKRTRQRWCDFVVGTSNGDFQILHDFYEHSKFCWASGSCKWRTTNELLNKTCVVTQLSDTRPEDVTRKGSAVWRQISL